MAHNSFPFTEETVSKLRDEMEILKPKVEETAQKSEVTIEEIARNSSLVEELEVQIEKEEERVRLKERECKTLEEGIQIDLDVSLSALNEALASLKLLKEKDILEIRDVVSPSHEMKMVVRALLIMMGIEPQRTVSGRDSYYCELLQNPQTLLKSLFTFDKDHIPESVITNIDAAIDNDAFRLPAICKMPKASACLCLWILAVHRYHHQRKQSLSRREILNETEAELEIERRRLEGDREKLQSIRKGRKRLKSEYDA